MPWLEAVVCWAPPAPLTPPRAPSAVTSPLMLAGTCVAIMGSSPPALQPCVFPPVCAFLAVTLFPLPPPVPSNIIHGSDTVENARKEIELWFPEGVSAWESASKSWIYE